MKAGNWSRRSRPPLPQKNRPLRNIQTVRDDTLLAVRLAYYDVLLAAQQITVHQASVELLQQELDDQQRRYDAGTVPKFNVLRAEVALANQRPALIQAQNSYRISKNNLSNLLGYNLPRDGLGGHPAGPDRQAGRRAVSRLICRRRFSRRWIGAPNWLRCARRRNCSV